MICQPPLGKKKPSNVGSQKSPITLQRRAFPAGNSHVFSVIRTPAKKVQSTKMNAATPNQRKMNW